MDKVGGGVFGVTGDWHGSHGRAVDDLEAPDSEALSSVRWAGSSLAGRTVGFERDSLDSPDGRPLARSSRPLPFLPDVPSTFSTLGEDRRVGAGAPGVGEGFEGARGVGPLGMLH